MAFLSDFAMPKAGCAEVLSAMSIAATARLNAGNQPVFIFTISLSLQFFAHSDSSWAIPLRLFSSLTWGEDGAETIVVAAVGRVAEVDATRRPGVDREVVVTAAPIHPGGT